jgi:flavin-dependent dehydrogenase
MASRKGISVVLVEKKEYPFHKVCGEYISLESLNLLQWLGLNPEGLPVLNQFRITHPNGTEFRSPLPLGGIGISRFSLDHLLKQILEKEGGLVLENTKATGFSKEKEVFGVTTSHPEFPEIEGRALIGSFGRNKPQFASTTLEKETVVKSFVGVKMHVMGDLPKDQIELHHFPGGYCGISAIENDKYCLCYLIEEQKVKELKGNLEDVEARYLFQNPTLKKYLQTFPKATPRVSTAGVMFEKRPRSQDGMLFLGDSARMIPPLAGNGMSMALHSAVLAIESLNPYFKNQWSLDQALQNYEKQWNSTFGTRLWMANRLQKIMEQPGVTALSMATFRMAPFLFRWFARQTHGKDIPLPS